MVDQTSVWNFGRNVEVKPANVLRPRSADELLELLVDHRGEKIRVCGSLHAWSDAVKTSGILVDVSQLSTVSVDAVKKVAQVGGGCTVKSLLNELKAYGLTLPSIGLIDEQTVAGATATATHGSGNHSLSQFLTSVTVVHFDNETGEPKLSRIESGAALNAARCSLGLLGVIVELEIQCRPQYNVAEFAAAHSSLDAVLALESDNPLQQFYLMPWSWKYFGHHRAETNESRSKLATLYRWYCFLVIDVGLHLAVFGLVKILKQSWLIQFFFKRILPLTIARNWRVVDDAHAMLVMEHELFRHIEIEFFVQRSNLESATEFLVDLLSQCGGRAMRNESNTNARVNECGMADQFRSLHSCYVHHYPICYRRILNDEALIAMSSASSDSDEDWYAISLISYQWPTDRTGFFQMADFIANSFAKLFSARCHWGKYNPLKKEANQALYPRLKEFRDIVEGFDNQSVFTNEWLKKVV